MPRVLDGIAIVETDFERCPRWSWQEENAATVRADALIKIAQLLAVTAVMGLLAAWRFGRRQPV